MKKFLFCFFLFLSIKAFSEGPKIYRGGFIHEALMTQEYGETLLNGVPMGPPTNIREKRPRNTDGDLVWISGYWDWSNELKDFYWISGVWRRPPPGHIWTPGFWQNYGSEWVRIHGFWSPKAIRELDSISQAPPDDIDERIPLLYAKDHFWAHGHWNYDENKKDYVWHAGKWTAFQKEWIYVPARYIWHLEGYFFIPSYWDWPLEKRGVAYASLWFKSHENEMISYEPKVLVSSNEIIQRYFSYYPYYLNFYHCHYFYYPEFWNEWREVVPPWWKWDMWWNFAWFDQLGLWWWWSHPGYISPRWLDVDSIQKLPPPPDYLVQEMKKVLPPVLVTPQGVVSPEQLLIAGRRMHLIDEKPILPSDLELLEQIQKAAAPKSLYPKFKPEGISTMKEQEALPKVFFGPNDQEFKYPPKRATIPDVPSAQDFLKKQIKRSSKKSPFAFLSFLGIVLNYFQPKETPTSRHTRFYHAMPPSRSYGPNSRVPEHSTPHQGSFPYNKWPPLPRAQQDLGDLMTHPQPQRNPGPSLQYPQGLYP